MFDLITGKVQHGPRHQTLPMLISVVTQTTLVAAIFLSTVLFVVAPPPQMEMMMAFVAAPPPPPPPPPPAPPPPEAQPVVKPVPTSGEVAPVEEPKEIAPEPLPRDLGEAELYGVPGGDVGGVVGGLVPEIPPPPPPPPPPEPRKPLRIGGQLKEPSLIHRVEPVYPALAIASQMQGIVILEAIVDEEGRVESVRVLRSPGVFDNAAVEAVRQWRYSPVILNGRPEKFILTVVVSFRLQ